MKSFVIGIAMAAALGTSALAADCPKLPEGMRCHAENGDGRAMYVVGREAYDEARKSGDFSEARMWAQKSMEAKFFPASKMLWKMVHLQVAEGHHKDMVQGHIWLKEAIAGGADYLVPFVRRLEAKMTSDQIAEAHAREDN